MIKILIKNFIQIIRPEMLDIQNISINLSLFLIQRREYNSYLINKKIPRKWRKKSKFKSNIIKNYKVLEDMLHKWMILPKMVSLKIHSLFPHLFLKIRKGQIQIIIVLIKAKRLSKKKQQEVESNLFYLMVYFVFPSNPSTKIISKDIDPCSLSLQ